MILLINSDILIEVSLARDPDILSRWLELGDALIAASAQASAATLWTRNRKHYPMKDIQFF